MFFLEAGETIVKLFGLICVPIPFPSHNFYTRMYEKEKQYKNPTQRTTPAWFLIALKVVKILISLILFNQGWMWILFLSIMVKYYKHYRDGKILATDKALRPGIHQSGEEMGTSDKGSHRIRNKVKIFIIKLHLIKIMYI